MASISYTTQGFILLLAAASLLAVSEAKTIVVGGSEGWRFGFNYTEWVLQNSPFYINDELVFNKAKILAGPNQGADEGFKVELNQWRPYYFASGDKDGYDCKDRLMKLFAVPLLHWNN
ncbi:uncharacterized protein LOC126784291 [Argentina anserina]|uniref:uncharacterized protein LOC126784291 n=1 Tax=Argentina anserina TaxID=57926 RepID=UPI0021768E46|nr:uncharacterized protein LOC126784291 [Potentilla anserina]